MSNFRYLTNTAYRTVMKKFRTFQQQNYSTFYNKLQPKCSKTVFAPKSTEFNFFAKYKKVWTAFLFFKYRTILYS